MGRNGAGKSTLLRHAAGLLEPTRGRVERAGRVALLLQNPGDYFIHERVAEEASAQALAAVGPGGDGRAQPARPLRRRAPAAGARDRHRCTAADASRAAPAVLALDEPTRGMDREAKAELAGELRRRARGGPGGDRRHARPRVRRRLRRARGAARRRARDRRRPGARAARRAAGTSPPRPRASSAAPAARCCPSRARSCCARRRRDAALGGRVPRSAGVVSWPLPRFCSSRSCSALGWLAYERSAPVGADGRGRRPRSRPSPRSAATRSWRCPTSSRSRR